MWNRFVTGAMIATLILLTMNLLIHPQVQEVQTQSVITDAGIDYAGRIALTFDDGPHPVVTPQILDILKEKKVKATFFTLGKQAECYPELVLREYEEEHEIGNHTYSHIQLTKANRNAFLSEIFRTNQILRDIIGENVTYMRPPFGAWQESVREESGMLPVLWTIDSKDWCSTDVDLVVNRVVENASDGDIILMHDQYDVTVTAVDRIITQLLQQGFDFVTVEDVLQ